MHDFTSEAFETRLNNLERQCAALRRQLRLYHSAGSLIVLGVVLLVVAGARKADEKTMDVGSLVIRDKENHPRIVLEVADGDPSLHFQDKDGTPRISLGLGGGPMPTDDPYMSFNAGNGLGGLFFGVGGGPFKTERPYVNLRDEKGTTRLWLGLSPVPVPGEGGKPGIYLTDENGKRLFQAPQP